MLFAIFFYYALYESKKVVVITILPISFWVMKSLFAFLQSLWVQILRRFRWIQKPWLSSQLWSPRATLQKKLSSWTSSSTPFVWWWTAGQATIFWFVGLWVVYLGYLAFQSLTILYLVLAAWIIAVAMESFIVSGSRRMPRWVSIAVSYLLLLLFLLAGMIIILPFILQQLSAIVALVVKYFYTMQSQISALWLSGYIQSLDNLPRVMQNYLVEQLASGNSYVADMILNNLSLLISTGSEYAKSIAAWWVSMVSSLFSFIGQVGLVLTIAVFFSAEKDRVVWFLTHRIVNQDQMIYRSDKIDVLYNKMWLWLKSQLWLCIYIGLIVYVVLRLLAWIGIDLPNKWALALMAWFTEFIPYIWPLLWGIPALILGTTMYGIPGMFAVGIAYYAIQWTENNVLIPLLMKKSLGVSPLVILLCVLIGWSVLWFIGILLAVPFAVILSILFDKDFE